MSDIYNEVLKEIEKQQWYCEFGKYTYIFMTDILILNSIIFYVFGF